MEHAHKFSDRLCLTTGQAARHCQVSIPALKRWIRDGRLAAFKTPGGHCRIELEELQRFLRQYGMPLYPTSAPAIRILIVDDESYIVDLFVDLLATDPREFTLDTATDGYDALIKVGMFRPSLLILGITGYPPLIPALLEAGTDACLPKPLQFRHARHEVEYLLASLEMAR
jgi:excisionase family DNA binding protein